MLEVRITGIVGCNFLTRGIGKNLVVIYDNVNITPQDDPCFLFLGGVGGAHLFWWLVQLTDKKQDDEGEDGEGNREGSDEGAEPYQQPLPPPDPALPAEELQPCIYGIRKAHGPQQGVDQNRQEELWGEVGRRGHGLVNLLRCSGRAHARGGQAAADLGVHGWSCVRVGGLFGHGGARRPEAIRSVRDGGEVVFWNLSLAIACWASAELRGDDLVGIDGLGLTGVWLSFLS